MLVDIVDVIPVSFLTVIDTLCWYILLLFSGEPRPPLSLPVEKHQPATAVPGTTQCCKKDTSQFYIDTPLLGLAIAFDGSTSQWLLNVASVILCFNVDQVCRKCL